MLQCRLILLFFVCLVGQASLNAQDLPMQVAARDIWLEKYPAQTGEKDFQFDRITRQGDLVVYERFDPASFIILMKTADKYALAGYSFQNLFFGNLSGQANQPVILEALAQAGQVGNGGLKGTRILTSSIGPLLQTQWGQGHFFNYYCPRDPRGPNSRVYVGCVAVAVGQIVKYYGGFNSFHLQHSYNSGFYGNLSATIGSYDWATMENTPITVDLEVSEFLSDVGILLNMCYGASGSTTNSHRTLEAIHELGYIGGILLRKSQFTLESWIEVFYQNLSGYKPILVTGGGHAFVCDGYDEDGLFHFNLGWDGYADGYYPLSAVMTMPVSEAFTELEPISWPKPPAKIGVKTAGQNFLVNWNYEPDQNPLLSRIYIDDQLFTETTDTVLNTGQLGPGIHQVYVSAVYADGESRWIGPVEVFVRGTLLSIQDPGLSEVIQKALGQGSSNAGMRQIYEGDLSRITSLKIDRPVLSMEGIGLCNHLKRLIIDGFPGPGLSAGPLENLTQLRILEWNGREMIHPEVLGKLNQLSELRIRQTPLESLSFLKNFNILLSFEYSDAPLGNHDALPGLPLLEELNLARTGIDDAEFISGLPKLIDLNLAGNQLTDSRFLSSLSNMHRADLADNRLHSLVLTDQLQSLDDLDVSDNKISVISITSELKSLQYLDLSGNMLKTPGRLFIYTPALIELDLSNNQLQWMGKQRCPSLETLDVSYNNLITTDWISLQPFLKRINLEHNRISDLSGLTKNNLYQKLNFLGLDKNPVSKQSFLESLPMLVEAIDSVTKPDHYQPLSPCYVTPSNGSRRIGPDVELEWITDTSLQPCVYDLFIVRDDSLMPVLQGLGSMKAVLEKRPAAAFSWVVASRTIDSIYYSGVYDVVSTAELTIPFKDGFEQYFEGELLSQQSEFWFIKDETKESNQNAKVVSSNYRTGLKSLELAGNETAILSTEHLKVPYMSIQFSVLVPPGQHGVFLMQNMNGIYMKLVWDESNTGKLFVNDKIYSTFAFDHSKWMDVDIMGHARNNNIHVKVGNKLLINDPWTVPEGIICIESIEFSGQPDEVSSESPDNRFYIDDVRINSSSTSGTGIDLPAENLISVYPNPFSDYVNISFSEPGRYNISIIDMTGREAYRQPVDAKMNTVTTIPLSGLSPGIYTLHTGKPNVKPVRIVRS